MHVTPARVKIKLKTSKSLISSLRNILAKTTHHIGEAAAKNVICFSQNTKKKVWNVLKQKNMKKYILTFLQGVFVKKYDIFQKFKVFFL